MKESCPVENYRNTSIPMRNEKIAGKNLHRSGNFQREERPGAKKNQASLFAAFCSSIILSNDERRVKRRDREQTWIVIKAADTDVAGCTGACVVGDVRQ